MCECVRFRTAPHPVNGFGRLLLQLHLHTSRGLQHLDLAVPRTAEAEQEVDRAPEGSGPGLLEDHDGGLGRLASRPPLNTGHDLVVVLLARVRELGRPAGHGEGLAFRPWGLGVLTGADSGGPEALVDLWFGSGTLKWMSHYKD